MTTLTLKYPERPLEQIQADINAFPSEAWFGLHALEKFTSAKEVLDSGRVDAKPFSQVEEASEPLTCWRCNGDIHHKVNDGWCMPYKPKPKFNDHYECRGKHNKTKVMCVACEAVSHSVYHPNFKLNALYTKDSMYQLTLDEDLISFLISPPPPPFVFCMAENNSQHMLWLSHYTADTRLISIMKSRKRYLVNRESALSLALLYKQALDLTNAIRGTHDKIPLATPLLSTRKEINTPTANNMQLSTSVILETKVKDGDTVECIAQRKALSKVVDAINTTHFDYGNWYVSTMYLKAILNNLHAKPMSAWQTSQIKK